MKPCGVRIWTDDLAKSRAFYTEVLPFKVNVDGMADGFVIIGTDSIDLILEADDGGWSARHTALSFWVDDIHATTDELKEKGVEFVSGPEQQFWGGWLADFKDCTGNTLTLVQNAD
ncbi:MAG: VOC family protein [Verrucomicrobiota bacterium]